MHVILQGFMGCGKSTLAPKLAQALDYEYLDLDTVFIKTFNTSITEFVNQYGLKAFRSAEQELLKSILTLKLPHVIALGGGTLTQMRFLKSILSSSIVLYLNTPLPIIQKRLKKDFHNRPLLNTLDSKTRPIFINSLWLKRQKYYTLSHLQISDKTNLKVLALKLKRFKPYTA